MVVTVLRGWWAGAAVAAALLLALAPPAGAQQLAAAVGPARRPAAARPGVTGATVGLPPAAVARGERARRGRGRAQLVAALSGAVVGAAGGALLTRAVCDVPPGESCWRRGGYGLVAGGAAAGAVVGLAAEALWHAARGT